MSHTGNSKSPFAQFQQTPTSKGNSIFSLHANKKSGKLISHLLGLDQEQSRSSSANAHVIAFIRNIKISDLFQGVKFTPNFMFFLLFLGFFLWIFVIYWVRHNEPLANQVLGTPKGDVHKTAVDRQLVAGIKNAFPVQTSNSTGEIYVPGSTPLPAQPSSQQAMQVQPMSAQAMPAPPAQQAPGQTSSLQPQSFAGYQVSPAPVLASPTNAAPAQFGTAGGPVQMPANAPQLPSSAYGQSVVPAGAGAAVTAVNPAAAYPVSQSNYMVGVPSSSGPRLKTIVNR